MNGIILELRKLYVIIIDLEDSNKINGNDKLSEDEESSSFDDSGFKNLTIDEENANNGAQGECLSGCFIIFIY